MATTPSANTLFYGDNLEILRTHIADESVDLVYLDPPFNSNATYNVLFKAPGGEQSQAQIEAFDDTWHWNISAERAFDEVIGSGNSDAANMLIALQGFLGKNDIWSQLFTPLSDSYTTAAYRYKDENSRLYRLSPLTGPGGAEKGNPVYEWNGHTRAWRVSKKKMQEMHDAGILAYSGTGYVSKKLYLDQSKGTPVQTVWTDIPALSGSMAERLGYPTQKPVALLERIISASSNEGDLVLDPFCGCGTTVHAAQKLNRRWIGIDITHLAIGLIQRRLHDAFPLAEFKVEGVPKDLGAAQMLADSDKHQFQLWALSMVEAQPYKGGQKGADRGVDGYIYFKPDGKTTKRAIVSVKGGANVSDTMVKDLITTVEHEGADMGVFLTLAPPTKPMVKRAAEAGLYKPGGEFGKLYDKSYPKVQILTIAELFDGKRPDMPFIDASVFRKAKREAAPTGQGDLGV